MCDINQGFVNFSTIFVLKFHITPITMGFLDQRMRKKPSNQFLEIVLRICHDVITSDQKV